MKEQFKLYLQHEPTAFAVAIAMIFGAITGSMVAFVAALVLVLFFAKVYSGRQQ